MPPYLQTCSCKGRAVSAVKDARRYDAEAEDTRREIALLERELEQLYEKGRKARLRLMESEFGGSCEICADTGVIEGNGSAQIGGPAV